MKQSSIIAMTMAALISSAVYAQAIHDADPLNREAAMLFVSAGELYPITSWPVEGSQLITALEGLAERNQETGQEARDLIRRLKATEGSLFWQAELATAFCARTFERLLPSERSRYYDTLLSYLGKPQLMTLSGGVNAPEGISADMAFSLRKEWDGVFSSAGNIPEFGQEGNPLPFDNHAMERADLRFILGKTIFSFGRNAVKTGQSGFFSLYPDDSLPYLDRIGISSRGDRIAFDWYASTIQPIPAFDGYDLALPAQLEGGDDQRPTVLVVKRLALQNRIFRFGLGQVVLYSRANAYYTLADFLPLIDWHAADVRPNNMALLLDAGWVPIPGLETFASIGFDEISGEAFGIVDSDIPTTWALLLGAKGNLLKGSAVFSPKLQLGYTHYLWGNYDAALSAHSSEDSTLARAVYRYASDGGAILMPLTSPFGPGAAWMQLELEFVSEDLPVSLAGDLLILGKFPEADLVSTRYARNVLLDRIPPFAVASLGVAATHTSRWTELYARPALYLTPADINVSFDLVVRLMLTGKESLSGEKSR